MLKSYRLYTGETIGSHRLHHHQKTNLFLVLVFWGLGALFLLLSTAPLEASQTNKSPLAANEMPSENQRLK